VNDWLSGIPSPQTQKTYKAGIRKFEEFFKKPIEDLLSKTDVECGHVIDAFYSWLKQSHPQNTCRNLVNSPIQYLKFHGKNPKYKKSLGMYHTVVTVRDHMLTIEECQKMASVADLREQIILEVGLLGLRVGDVSELHSKTFDLQGACPIEIQICTRKEGETAFTFISEEFKGLLEKYLSQLDKSNPYLFQSNRRGNLSGKRFDQILKELFERAGLKASKILRWHCFRKLVLRTCAQLGVNSWSAKMLVGKAVSPDIATYISGIQLKNDFLKVSSILKLFPKPIVNGQNKQLLDTVFEVLRALVEDKLKDLLSKIQETASQKQKIMLRN
jgi:site-specific recombinase XerD